MLGNNMFAYCLNNPVNLVDDAGDSATLSANPNSSYYEDTTGGGGGGGIILGALTLVDSLWDTISRSYARSKSRSYKTPEEVHHLVARMAWNAAPSAAILEALLPDGVENPINKISIKTGLHRRLHSNLYHGIANTLVITAYYSTNDPKQQQQNVVLALGILRGIVSYLNTLAPY